MKQLSRFAGLGWLIMAALLAVFAVGCRSQRPTATPAAPSATTTTPETLPAVEAFAVIEPETGGVVRLRDGAELSLPPQALSAKAGATLRTLDAPPAAAVPRSLLGRAYEFALEDGELTGVGLLRVPLPAAITSDQYDIAPYRWNGTTWERINARLTGDALQFGVNGPGIFALQGTWRLADATLALIKPETPSGQPLIPLAVAGQYRFSAVPALQGQYVPARLTLKQDVSGGAGRVTGNPELDITVGEATLWFQPDPAQSQGIIDFSHVFEIAPGKLDVPPGSTTRLYASLVVEDAIAPTRRLSTGVEYTQILPIQIIDMELVRPGLTTEGQYALRWHVQLDGQTFLLLDAAATGLPLDDVLAQGGLGAYRFTLEAEIAGVWTTVSNEVQVQLALKPTETPSGGPESTPGLVAVTSPTSIATPPTPGQGEQPVTPTRRPTPSTGGAAPTVTPTPITGATMVPTATTTRPAWASVFWADRYTLTSSECTALHWQVENVISVFLDGQAVTGNDTRQVCPTQTTTYTLRINSNEGVRNLPVTITVSTQSQAVIEFAADNYRITSGQCTVLRWDVTDVRAVYLNGQGVAGEASQQVCPTVSTDYILRVEGTNGTVTTRTITIVVTDDPVIDMRFWADQYTMPADTCTMLRWDVRNVREVFLDDQGVAGSDSRQVCPDGTQYYTLRAVTVDEVEVSLYVSLTSGEPSLAPSEVIAQGIVNEVTRQDDLDPATPGAQSGYRLIIDGINRLFAGNSSWSQAVVTLRLPQDFLDVGEGDLLSWPINPGQSVEFRAGCEGATCTLQLTLNSYLYLRSP